MMLRCSGQNCPLRTDCYRYTQPHYGRDAFGQSPFDVWQARCDYFVSNWPSEEHIRHTAYFIWLAEGRPADKAEEHWQRAQQSWLRVMGRISD